MYKAHGAWQCVAMAAVSLSSQQSNVDVTAPGRKQRYLLCRDAVIHLNAHICPCKWWRGKQRGGSCAYRPRVNVVLATRATTTFAGTGHCNPSTSFLTNIFSHATHTIQMRHAYTDDFIGGPLLIQALACI